MRPRLKHLATALGIALVVFLTGLWWFTSKFIEPVPAPVPWPTYLNVTHEDVSFHARDQFVLKGWFFAQSNSTNAVVLLHGISVDRRQMLDRAVWLNSLGYNVLIYDARGCGESAPTFRSFGFHESNDFLGAVDWLQARGMKQVGCIGFSQGAATILLATKEMPESVRAIVAESCYTDLSVSTVRHVRYWTGFLAPALRGVVAQMLEWRLGTRLDAISPLREIASLKVPIYLIGGSADQRAPPSGVQQLYDAAPGEKYLWFVPGATHGDFYACDEMEYKKRVGPFFKEYLP